MQEVDQQRPVVSPTSESFRFKKRNERYACICNLILSATDQAKAVREQTSHVGETTRRRNDRTRQTIVCDF